MTTPTDRRDADLKAAVADELDWTQSVNSTHLGVSVTDGAVTLSGEVDSYQEKVGAMRAAQRVRGVTALAQEITVRSTNLTDVTDSDVARSASDALLLAVDVPDTIKASVHDHVITLSGEGLHFQRQAALRAVRYVGGVRDVVDEVGVQTALPTSGSNVKTSIDRAMARSVVIDGTHVTVFCDPDGSVVLDGTVRSWDERRRCEDIAWAGSGVTSVTDKLQVRW